MDDRLRILNLRDAFVFGGPDATLLGWCAGLDSTRFWTAIACFENPGGVESVLLEPASRAGVPIFTVPWGARKRIFAAVDRVVDLIRRERIDVLHTHDWKADLVGYFAARRAGIPVMTTVYVWFGQNSLRRVRFYEWLDRQIIRRMNLVTAISEATRRDTVALGIPSGKCRTVLSGVDFARFDVVVDKAALRASLGIPSDHQVVGYLARLYPEKAHSVLLDAARRVIDRRPNVTFLLVGGGPLETKLRARAAELGIERHVLLAGTRRDVPAVVQLFDVQAHASYAEGIPLALYEGMAAGRPVVGSNVDGIPEVVIHGETGLLVPPGEAAPLADSLLMLLEDQVLAARFGQAGRRLIEDRYALSRAVRDLEGNYLMLVGRARPTSVTTVAIPSQATDGRLLIANTDTTHRSDISVVIVSYAARNDLRRCLASLDSAARERVETVVFDNGSSDGTSEMVSSEFPGVRLVRSAQNIGLSRGINQAVRHTTGEFVCLLDADTIIEAGALDALAGALRQRQAAGVVAGRMLEPDGAIQETARRFPTPLNGLFGRQTLLSRLFPRNRVTADYLERSHIDERDPFEVDWVAAACMMFPRKLFEQLGGFDEDYFVYWVDADWCWRVRQTGRSVFCVPAARIQHVEQNRTGRRKSARAIRSFHHGAYLFYRKHHVRGAWHPFRCAAWCGLALRCQLIIAANAVRR